MFGMGPGELMLVALIVLILVGPSDLPSLADRLREARARRFHEPSRTPDWVFIGTISLFLSFVLAIVAAASAGQR